VALYEVAGASGAIELPVPLIVHLLPISPEKRPGIKRQTPGAWVQHETANYNEGADAAMHDRWLHNLTGTYVSFHFCVDDTAIYQFVPVDEVTWQAADGAGPGNMAGVSCELCVNRDADWAKARANCEALAAGVSKALGITAITRHYDYNADDPDRHYCPKEMMTSGYWPTFVANVQKIIGEPVEEPPVADSKYPVGMDEGIAALLFGKVMVGKTPYQFDPKGPVSKAWLLKGKETGQFPSLVAVKTFDTRQYFVFGNGSTLWRPNKNEGFRWL